jgi:serine protease Do
VPIPVRGSVAEALRRSTVQVFSGRGRASGGGSGVVIGDGRVITNAHVVRRESIHVEPWNGNTVTASCIKLDAGRDLALLSAPGLEATAATLSDSTRLRAGTPVFAVGNPLGFVGAVSSGVVHAVGALAGVAWIQADLRLAPGNSGGPLADFHGQVLGINTMVVSNGLALAIPSQAVQGFLNRTRARRGLGITVRPIELEGGKLGIMILEVETGGAAERASLLPGDILTVANESALQSLDDLQAAIDGASGKILRLGFRRGGQRSLRQVAVPLEPERVPNAA